MMHDADDRLERLIDRASSSLTEAETSPAFVTRVMAALDAPPRRGATPWTLVAPAAACLVALLVLGGWWAVRPDRSADVSSGRAVTSRALPTKSAAAVPSSTSAPAVSRTSPAIGPTATPRPMRQAIGRRPAQVRTFDAIAIAHVEIAPVVTDADGLVLPPVGALPPIAVDDVAIDPIEITGQPPADTPQSQGGRQ